MTLNKINPKITTKTLDYINPMSSSVYPGNRMNVILFNHWKSKYLYEWLWPSRTCFSNLHTINWIEVSIIHQVQIPLALKQTSHGTFHGRKWPQHTTCLLDNRKSDMANKRLNYKRPLSRHLERSINTF